MVKNAPRNKILIIISICFVLMFIAMGVIGYQVIKYKALLTKDPMVVAINLRFQNGEPSCYCTNQLSSGESETWFFNKTASLKSNSFGYN